MNGEHEKSERLSKMMRDLVPAPPPAKPDEEARILAAARRAGAKRTPFWAWGTSLAAACAAALTLVFFFRSRPPQGSGDLEAYLQQTIVAVYADEEYTGSLPDAGKRLLTLVDYVE